MIDIEKVREALETMEYVGRDAYYGDTYETNEAVVKEAINELERLQQKETPMIVKMINNGFCIESRCPECDNEVDEFNGQQYCSNCGQHLDWNDME